MTKYKFAFHSSHENVKDPTQQFPPLKKGGQGGFCSARLQGARKSKSPSIPLFQRGRQDICRTNSAPKFWARLLAQFILILVFLSSSNLTGAQEKVIVGHSARAALSIGPLLYGIERGFYRDEGIDLVYVSLRADLGIKALVSGDIDYSYSTGTIIRGAILGVPVRNLTFDFSRVLHALMSRPDIPNAAALRGKRVGVSSFGATRR